MTPQDWNALYDTIVVDDEDPFPVPPKPTDAQLDEFETVHGFKLPRSYRDFVQRFGAG